MAHDDTIDPATGEPLAAVIPLPRVDGAPVAEDYTPDGPGAASEPVSASDWRSRSENRPCW